MEWKSPVAHQNEEVFFGILRQSRWPEGVTCPSCSSKRYWIDREESPKLQYRCRDCNKWWTDFSGTIFQRTHLPLSKWFRGMELFRRGNSALSVAANLEVNRHTAERMRHLLKKEPRTYELLDLFLKSQGSPGPVSLAAHRSVSGKKRRKVS